MADKINWGIIGTGMIARTFAAGLRMSETGRLVAVASREQKTADAFVREFGGASAIASYEALLADKRIDAVYISTPHAMHAEWTIRAARAGKHILCEKPIALNHADAMAMIQQARRSNVFFMEAFMYRCHPQTEKLVELLRRKAIGEVRMIQASFSFQAEYDPGRRLFKNALGGGAILDVGCYTASMARLVAGQAMGKPFADPIDVKGVAHLGKTGVDEWATASLRFPGDILAQLSTGVSLNQENVVRIFGTDGNITIPNPWLFNRIAPDQGLILLHKKGDASAQEIHLRAGVTSFTFEADLVGQAILSGAKQAPSPAMTWDDSLGNIQTLDRWREAIGLTYDSEKPDGYRTTTVRAEQLARNESASMKFGKIPGIEKPVSRLIMGCDNQHTFTHAAIMCDDFFERGGTTFDTAWIYGGGVPEKLLGQWIKHRGVRDQVVVIAKGGHTPLATPRDITRQLHESLDRLGIDQADLYLLHRDNPDVPVGEFVDVLNEHQKVGRFNAFGGSNWTTARIDAANDYAKSKGLAGFSALSNNFSLARMIDAPWKGSISASDADSRAWLAKSQTPLLAWSSQARGYFLEGNVLPHQRDDAEMIRCWQSDDNAQRRQRAGELAKAKNVDTINIALAYVLHQPFPTFALIGPRTLSETESSFKALDIQLSEQEVKWLNLEE